MATKAKGSEAIVKELARKEANKKCFDCGRGGPQQNVNLTVGTFVCTSCCGLLRNFNHKVKTINMYTFPEAEVKMLEEGGNKKAKKYWLYRWDEVQNKPDPENAKSVETFMKLMYVEKRWCKDTPIKGEAKKKDKHASAEGEKERRHSRADSEEGPKKETVKETKKKERKSGAHKESDEGFPSIPVPTKKSAPAPAASNDIDLFSFSDSGPGAPAATTNNADSFDSFGSSDDFGSKDTNGFGSTANGFDAGFGSTDDFSSGFDSAPAQSHPPSTSSFNTPPQKAPLAVLIEQAKEVTVPQSAVKSLVSTLRTMQAQFKLDSSQAQAVVFQAFSHILPPAVAEAMNITVAGGAPSSNQNASSGFGAPKPAPVAAAPKEIDLFADLQIEPTTRPSYMPAAEAEPDSGNPFGSDDEDDVGGFGNAPAAQHHAPQQSGFGGGFGQPQQAGGFGQPQQQAGGFGQPQQPQAGGFGGQFGQPSPQGFQGGYPPMGFGQQPQQGFGGPQGFAPQGFPGQNGGFGQPGQFGAQGGFPGAHGGFPQQNMGFPGQGGFNQPQQQSLQGFNQAPQQQQQQAPQQPQQPKQDLFASFNPLH